MLLIEHTYMLHLLEDYCFDDRNRLKYDSLVFLNKQDDGGMLLLEIVAADKGFVLFVCFNFSLVFDNESSKPTKLLIISGFTMNEPSNEVKHSFLFTTFKSLSLLLKLKNDMLTVFNKKISD